MRIFKNKPFHVWAIKQGLSGEDLARVVREIEKGLIDANLGGNIYKKRLAVRSQGKRSGARTIFAYKQNERIFFLFGYTKNAQDNISEVEKRALKELGAMYFNLSNEDLNSAVKQARLFEVQYD